jgi:hypothetical protein
MTFPLSWGHYTRKLSVRRLGGGGDSFHEATGDGVDLGLSAMAGVEHRTGVGGGPGCSQGEQPLDECHAVDGKECV